MTTLAIIEDDRELREELVEDMRFRGHKVYSAANGAEGFRIITEVVPDIVLSDVDMPVENGFDLMRRVRENNKKFADISFLFVSGKDRSQDVLSGLKAGADDYITKPVDYDYLASKIDAVSRKKDRLFDSWSVSNVGLQIKEAVMTYSVVLGAVAVLGFGVLLVLYYLKSGLGIDIFRDTHLSDLI
jgi:DNA-binding response OmpR family regulator